MRTIKLHTGRGDRNFNLSTRTLPRGTRLYRWIPEADNTWSNYANHNYLRGMVVGDLKNSTLGGGLYVSENPYDWFNYSGANRLVIIQLEEDVQILDLSAMMSGLAGEEMTVCNFANLLSNQHPAEELLTQYGIVGYEHRTAHNGEIVLVGCQKGSKNLFTVTNTPRFADFDFKDHRWLRATTQTSRLTVIHNVLRQIFNIDINQDTNPKARLLSLLECTDLYDLLKGRDFGPDFFDTWRRAARIRLPAEATDLEILNALFRAVHRKELHYRSHDVIAGGGLEKDGTPATVRTDDGQRYIRATERQYQLLKNSNKLIAMTSDSGPITNPARHFGSGVDTAKYAVRYKYPGLHNYELLANHKSSSGEKEYPALESLRGEYNQLRVALNSAGFNPDHMTSDEQKRLTSTNGALKARYERFISDMVSRLFLAVLANKELTISEKYQKLMSIHPFPDGNGRILRAFFRYKTGGAPLFMPTWDFDIFYTPSEFESIVFRGIIDFYRIADSIVNNPRVHNISDSDTLWCYALQSCIFWREGSGPVDITRVKEWFRTAPEPLFEKKLALDIQYRLSSTLLALLAPAPAQIGSSGAAAMPVPQPVVRSAAPPVSAVTPGTLFHRPPVTPPAPPANSGIFGAVEEFFRGLRGLFY